MAIKIQSRLSQWPTKVTWKPRKKDKVAQRQILAKMYQDLVHLKAPKSKWFAIAQLGLLHANLGMEQATFSTWIAQIKAHPNHHFVKNAVGLMLREFNQHRSWHQLRLVSYLAMRYRCHPIDRYGRTVDPKRMYARALYHLHKNSII